jgi:hypothetical protein
MLSASLQVHQSDLAKRIGEEAKCTRNRTEEIAYAYTSKMKDHVTRQVDTGVGVIEQSVKQKTSECYEQLGSMQTATQQPPNSYSTADRPS